MFEAKLGNVSQKKARIFSLGEIIAFPRYQRWKTPVYDERRSEPRRIEAKRLGSIGRTWLAEVKMSLLAWLQNTSWLEPVSWLCLQTFEWSAAADFANYIEAGLYNCCCRNFLPWLPRSQHTCQVLDAGFWSLTPAFCYCAKVTSLMGNQLYRAVEHENSSTLIVTIALKGPLCPYLSPVISHPGNISVAIGLWKVTLREN